MRGKILLIVASTMALGSFANDLSAEIIVIDKKQDLPSIKQAPIYLVELQSNDIVFNIKPMKVEGDEWDSVTIIYADEVLPGYKNPVIPQSHAPPEAVTGGR